MAMVMAITMAMTMAKADVNGILQMNYDLHIIIYNINKRNDSILYIIIYSF